MLPSAITLLCQEFRKLNAHITIETAGTIDRNVECDLMSISPKFASSAPDRESHPKWESLHHERRMPVDTMRRLIERAGSYQLKFVVDSPDDFQELIETVDRIGAEHDHVWIMPQGSTNEAMDAAAHWLKPWTQSQNFRYCERMQIRWYGNRRGT